MVRFGVFEADLASGELRRRGLRVKLQERPFKVLALLLGWPGEIVTREDLRKTLWPADTFVDFDNGINTAVNKLREALGDSAENPRFIETVGRRGYRFICPADVGVGLAPPSPGGVSALPTRAPQGAPLQANRIGQNGSVQAERSAPGEPGASSTDPASCGSRFVEEKVADLDASSPPVKEKAADLKERRPALLTQFLGSRRAVALLAASATFVVTALLSYWWFSSPPLPRVIRTVEVTHSGRVEAWARIVTDGARLYYLEIEGHRRNLVQTSVAGGEAEPMRTPFERTRILDLSPDQSEFLLGNFGTFPEMPLWTMPVAGGSARRVGEITVDDAMWFPDGESILYAKGSDLWVVERDGRQARKFVSTSGSPWWFVWSPDHRVLRFTVTDAATDSRSLWEVAADGTHLHRLLSDWDNPPQECCGHWTPDGKYFLFTSGRGGSSNIWALREAHSFLRGHSEPMQLTMGPIQFWDGVLGRDGKRLFVFGNQPQIEMVRYDGKSGQFLPYLPGIGAWSIGVSRDGQWIAYDAGEALWRSKADGSAHLQLTFGPEVPHDPHWSPDGKQIAFWTTLRERPAKMRIVSAEGGPSREVAPEWSGGKRPDWSPDGQSLVFEVSESAAPASRPNALYVVDVKTNQASKVPGSEGLIVPEWSPAGEKIAAVTDDSHKLMLFDFKTRQWTPVATGAFLTCQRWSRDEKYLYFQDRQEADQSVYRLRLVDRYRERVTGCEKLLQSGGFRCALLALDPNDSPVLQLLRRLTDIYALDLDLP